VTSFELLRKFGERAGRSVGEETARPRLSLSATTDSGSSWVSDVVHGVWFQLGSCDVLLCVAGLQQDARHVQQHRDGKASRAKTRSRLLSA
jgi:hypothetical protein